jgi:hypothetical protein
VTLLLCVHHRVLAGSCLTSYRACKDCVQLKAIAARQQCNDAHATDSALPRLLPLLQGHPGMVAAAAPWLDGPTCKRFFPYLSDVAFLLVFVRDQGSGRVSVRQAGRPIIDYWPGKVDQQAILLGLQTAARAAVAAGGCRRWCCG